MKFAYTIIYVEDVPATVEFYENAFGLTRRFIHESNLYAEMETGETALAFADNEIAEANGVRIRHNVKKEFAAGFEVGLVSHDPERDFGKAIIAGASSVKVPQMKPWGQTVAYVHDLNGCLVEIATPMTAKKTD